MDSGDSHADRWIDRLIYAFLSVLYLMHAFLSVLYLMHAFLSVLYLMHAFLSVLYLSGYPACPIAQQKRREGGHVVSLS